MKLKFCGFKTRETIIEALSCKVDYIGIIFAKSKRQVTKELARKIIEDLDFGDTKLVGVFADQSIDEVLDISEYVGVDIIQIHGNEDIEYLNELREKTTKEIWRAIPGNRANLTDFCKIPADIILIDSTKGGGSGELANWDLIKEYVDGFDKKYILAGGLNEDNIKKAMEFMKPYALDISSGIEINGTKDFDLMNKICRMVKKNG